MDPGSKVALFVGAGLLILGAGWGVFRWLFPVRDDPTSSEGQEIED